MTTEETTTMGINVLTPPEDIQNKGSVIVPHEMMVLEMLEPPKQEPEVKKVLESISREATEKASKQRKEFTDFIKHQEKSEESMLLDTLREKVMAFEKLLNMFLDPDIPTGRKAKKKFMTERQIFAEVGYKQFIRSIDHKVDAICKFEKNFSLDLFDGKNEEGWFRQKIDEALDGNFESAQDVVNSVLQIVIKGEIGVPHRRLVTKVRG